MKTPVFYSSTSPLGYNGQRQRLEKGDRRKTEYRNESGHECSLGLQRDMAMYLGDCRWHPVGSRPVVTWAGAGDCYSVSLAGRLRD